MDISTIIREATLDDIPEIVHQRRAMHEDMDYQDSAALDAVVATSAAYLSEAFSANC